MAEPESRRLVRRGSSPGASESARVCAAACATLALRSGRPDCRVPELSPLLAASPSLVVPLQSARSVAARGRRLAHVSAQRATPRAGEWGEPTEGRLRLVLGGFVVLLRILETSATLGPGEGTRKR